MRVCCRQWARVWVALAHELRKAGLDAVDLLVEEAVLVELKVARGLDDVRPAQCLNYLRATGLHLCLLLNFGTRA
jgi:GxxExxY protein